MLLLDIAAEMMILSSLIQKQTQYKVNEETIKMANKIEIGFENKKKDEN